MLPAAGGTESMILLGLLNVEGTEFMMILLVALLVFGPERLPEVARKAAKAITSARRMSDAFQNELRSAVDLPIDPLIKAQSGGSLSDVMNRLTAEAEAEEAAKDLASKEAARSDEDSTLSSDEEGVEEVSNDPFEGSVRDPVAGDEGTGATAVVDSDHEDNSDDTGAFVTDAADEADDD